MSKGAEFCAKAYYPSQQSKASWVSLQALLPAQLSSSSEAPIYLHAFVGC